MHCEAQRRRWLLLTLLLLLLLAGLLLLSPPVAAYCISTVCDDDRGLCGYEAFQPQHDPCKQTLAWQRSCIGFAVHEGNSSQISSGRARELLHDAFDTWEEAYCQSGMPGISVHDLGHVTCDEVEYEPDHGNVNVLVFRDDHWPHDRFDLALTTVTYDPNTGEIFDADMEINTHTHRFSEEPGIDEYDLLSVLTHEAGHALGLEHSERPNTTMAPDIMVQEMAHRQLSPDDIEGICGLYPTRQDETECNPIPQHGFSSTCASEQYDHSGTCQLTPPSGDAPRWWVLVAALYCARRARRNDRAHSRIPWRARHL